MPLGKFSKLVLMFGLNGNATFEQRNKKGGRITPAAPQSKNCHSILNIFFWSSHNVGNDCLSFSVLMLLLIFPARTAWMISGASSVNRIIRDTYASSRTSDLCLPFGKKSLVQLFFGAFCVCFGEKVLLIEQKSILCFKE